jgi:hypothetical protein
MDQRQLITFGYVQDVPLVPEFEKKQVMDRALSGDAAYFADFYSDISDQRFSMIVTEPQRIRYADEDEGFGQENDLWVQWVTEPLLCYYELKHNIPATRVWIMTPRAEVEECSLP